MTQRKRTPANATTRAMTPGQVAEVLNIHPATLARKIRDGVILLRRTKWSSAKYPRYSSSDVERLLRRAS